LGPAHRANHKSKIFIEVVRNKDDRDTGGAHRYISTVEITKGSINESLGHPRDIFRPVIGQSSAYALFSSTTTPSGDPSPSEADIRLTRSRRSQILQINMLDHVIAGQPFDGRPSYFSFKEAGILA
jgi:DNA repair protein RadC